MSQQETKQSDQSAALTLDDHELDDLEDLMEGLSFLNSPQMPSDLTTGLSFLDTPREESSKTKSTGLSNAPSVLRVISSETSTVPDYYKDYLKDGFVVMTDKEFLYYNLSEGKLRTIHELNEKQQTDNTCNILVNDNGKIFKFGGNNIKSKQQMKYCGYFEIDDHFKSSEWKTMKGSLNHPVHNAQCIELNNHLLLIGGDNNNECQEYDFKEEKWKSRESMDIKRSNFGICDINMNELIVFGGETKKIDIEKKEEEIAYLDNVIKYNYSLNKWYDLNIKMPNGPRIKCNAFHWKKYNENICVVAGGIDKKGNCNIFEGLDLNKKKWLKYANLKNDHLYPVIGALSYEGPHILYVAGLTKRNKLDVVERFDVRQNKWHDANNIFYKHKINAMAWSR